jgi:hypothetical protein
MLDIGYLLLLEMCGRGIFCSHSSDVGSHSSDQSEVRSSAEKLVHIQKSDTFTYAIYYHNETMTSPHKVWASDDVSQTLTILWAAGEHQMHVETTLRNVETKCMWRPPTEMWRPPARRNTLQSHRKIYTFARYSHDRLHFSVDFSLVPISDLRIIVSNYPGTPKSSTLFVDDSVWPCTFL